MDFLSQSMPCCCLFAEFLSVRAFVVNTLTPSAAPLSFVAKVPATHRRCQSLVALSASPALPRPCTKRVSVSPAADAKHTARGIHGIASNPPKYQIMWIVSAALPRVS